MSAHEIIQEVMKDNDFFRKSGGGLTISGGEPLAQPDFLLELIEEAQQKGLDIAIESSLFAPRSVVAEIAKHPLLWLADLKHVDPLAYRKGTSGDLEIAISNLRFLAQNDALFILRVPLIPGFNNNLEAVRRIFLTAAELYDMKKTPVQRQVDILPYHDLAKGKYASLGRKYPYPSGLRIPQDTLSEYVSLGTSFGLTIMIGG
jgi:pyruvate formate lyase activating enzyme